MERSTQYGSNAFTINTLATLPSANYWGVALLATFFTPLLSTTNLVPHLAHRQASGLPISVTIALRMGVAEASMICTGFTFRHEHHPEPTRHLLDSACAISGSEIHIAAYNISRDLKASQVLRAAPALLGIPHGEMEQP